MRSSTYLYAMNRFIVFNILFIVWNFVWFILVLICRLRFKLNFYDTTYLGLCQQNTKQTNFRFLAMACNNFLHRRSRKQRNIFIFKQIVHKKAIFILICGIVLVLFDSIFKSSMVSCYREVNRFFFIHFISMHSINRLLVGSNVTIVIENDEETANEKRNNPKTTNNRFKQLLVKID